jgi:molecular chaperone DnaJ
MGAFKNYYRVLDVQDFADPEVIKAAYRQLARKFHPDLNGGNAEAEERFKEINEAYDILGNPDKRLPYDNTLRLVLNKPNASPPKGVPPQYKDAAKHKGHPSKSQTKKQASDPKDGPSSTSSINDLFESFKRNFKPSSDAKTGHSGSDARQEKTPPPKPSGSQQSQSHQSQSQSQSQSQHAAGQKAAQNPPPKVKPTPQEPRSSQGDKPKRGEDVTVEALITPTEAESGVVKTVNVQHSELCKKCAGTGRLNGLHCATCQGEKVLVRLKKLDVRIPGGVKQGSKVRIAREGGRGVNGGEPGDLFLQIKISLDSALKIEGLNVYCDILLSVTDAVLGVELDVPTLSGKVKMAIPPLTSSGKVFRLKEQGVKNGNSRGDQFVTVQIQAPTKLSPREKELYSELNRLAKNNQED